MSSSSSFGVSYERSEYEVFNSRTTEQHIANTIFCVEASDYERAALWREHRPKVRWIDATKWKDMDVGYINDDKEMPVIIRMRWSCLNGQTVCFYEAVSRYVDWEIVGTYIGTLYPDADQRDAMSFQDCLDEVRRRNVKA